MTEFLCFEDVNDEFALIEQDVSFEDAVSACQLERAELAAITSQEEFNFILDLRPAEGLESFWIGTFLSSTFCSASKLCF